jgi:hypothetical protein
MYLKSFLFFIAVVSSTLNIHAQSAAVRYFIPIHFNLGATLANISSSGTPRINQKIGTALSLSTGLMMRVKDRAGLALEGGVNYQDYTFTLISPIGGTEYSLGKYDFKAAIRPFVIFPLKNNPHSKLSLNFTTGLQFHHAASMAEPNGLFFVNATVPQITTPFIAPEIGLVKTGRHMHIDIGVTYMYNFSNVDLLTIQLNSGTSQAVATTNLNYLGLVLRFSPEVWRNRTVKPKSSKPERRKENLSKPEIVRTENQPTNAVEAKLKPDRQQVKLDLKQEKLVLEVWDNSNIDGDSISIYFNGEPILLSHGLTAQKERIELTLKRGENTLLVEALNEGSISPNTAAFLLRNGRKKFSVNTITSKRQNEMILLNYEP